MSTLEILNRVLVALKRKVVEKGEIPLDETAEALGKLAVMLESDGASLPRLILL